MWRIQTPRFVKSAYCGALEVTTRYTGAKLLKEPCATVFDHLLAVA
jgi:hypothetical protein